MDPRNLSGSLKAAILIHAVGRDAAAPIFNHLSSEDKELVSNHLAQMGQIAPEVTEYVAQEFTSLAMRFKAAPQIAPPQPEEPQSTKSEDTADSAAESSNLDVILSLKADEIYELIKDEHPQTIAIILIHLKTAVASEVLSLLSDEIKTDVAGRIAGLDKVISGMVEEVNEVFKEILKDKKGSLTNVSGGIDRLAEILNQADEISSELILNEIEENDAEMAAQIKQKMFVFEDLILVDDRGFQKLLRKVETIELAVALKAASEEVREKVFKNMSERAGEMLKEEMEDLGPVRMKEVSDAQGNITGIIQEMEAKGEIIISGRRGEEVID
jgi:flagellar motor switch protein FliG